MSRFSAPGSCGGRLEPPGRAGSRREEGAPALPGAVRLHLAAGGARSPGPPGAPARSAAGKPRRCLISPRPGASSTSSSSPSSSSSPGAVPRRSEPCGGRRAGAGGDYPASINMLIPVCCPRPAASGSPSAQRHRAGNAARPGCGPASLCRRWCSRSRLPRTAPSPPAPAFCRRFYTFAVSAYRHQRQASWKCKTFLLSARELPYKGWRTSPNFSRNWGSHPPSALASLHEIMDGRTQAVLLCLK